MTNFRTDTINSRRIVRAFIDFLNSVEPAPGVDLEGLEVAKDCLTEVFRLDQLPESERPEPNLLLNVFSSQQRSSRNGSKTSQNEEAQIGPSTYNYPTADLPGTSQGGVGVRENDDTDASKDELFGQFFNALEKIHYFSATPNGDDDHVLLDRATHMFHDAVTEMERSGCKIYDQRNLADALKVLGNKAMQSNYSDAVERYTCAIALCENAVYYCNRAAAYTQMRKYNEAIQDCLKAIDIDPNYSKAYSRLGLAYYAQGKYSDAINKGFRKALELDPNNDAVKENIRVAEQKLNEEQRHRRQDSRNHFSGASGNQGGSAPFASVSFDATAFPTNFASMFTNMAENASQNPNGQARSAGAEHETHMPFGVNFVDGNPIPSDIANMFMNMAGSGATFQGGQGPTNRNRSSEQTHESEASNPISSFANMFMNMAGNGSSQGQYFQGGNNAGDDPGIRVGGGGGGGGAGFSFNFNGQTPEELNRTFRSMMGMFSGQSQGNPQNDDNNDADGRSASR